MDFIIKFMQDGGFFMYPIAILMVFGSIVVAERVYFLMYKYNANSAKLYQQVQKCIIENNIEGAINICNSNKDAPIYQVFKAALLNADRPHEEIIDNVEVTNLEVIPKLQTRMAYLSTISNVATLLGLLGTIVGLVQTFQAVGAVEASQKQQLLSVGISTAMNTTAFGLIVAIPCSFVFGFLFNRINTMVNEIDHYSARLLLLLQTGRGYFENFSHEGNVTTMQEPKVKGKDHAA